VTDADLAAERLAALLVAECENTALRVEVAHLRGERAAVVMRLLGFTKHRTRRAPSRGGRMTDTLTYVLASIKRTSESDYSWLLMPHEGAVLIREMERLRGEADRERAAVVAWLREQREYGTDALLGQGFANVCNILSDEIERGEHRRKEKE